MAAATALFSLRLFLAGSWGHLLAVDIAHAADTIDYPVILFLNRYAHQSWTRDTFFYLVDSNPLWTSPLLIALWWAWFKPGEDNERNREFVAYGIISSYAAVVVARILASTLPFRERPLHNPALHFLLPYNERPERLLHWSSFPSDHGAVWFALAAIMIFISWRVGVALFVYVCLTLALARIYLGVHYPTDILMGGLIGIAVASLGKYPAIRTAVARHPLQWMQKWPQFFYAGLFVITAEITESFASTNDLVSFFHTTAKAVLKLL